MRAHGVSYEVRYILFCGCFRVDNFVATITIKWAITTVHEYVYHYSYETRQNEGIHVKKCNKTAQNCHIC